MRCCLKYLKLMKIVSAAIILLYNFSVFECSGINLMNMYSYAVIKKLLDASVAYFLVSILTLGCTYLILDCLSLLVCYSFSNRKQLIMTLDSLHERRHNIFNIRLDFSNPSLYSEKTICLLI